MTVTQKKQLNPHARCTSLHAAKLSATVAVASEAPAKQLEIVQEACENVPMSKSVCQGQILILRTPSDFFNLLVGPLISLAALAEEYVRTL